MSLSPARNVREKRWGGPSAIGQFGRQNGDQVWKLLQTHPALSSRLHSSPFLSRPDRGGGGRLPGPDPALPAFGSDKTDRGMAAATSRETAQCHAKDQPQGGSPIASKVATSPNETGSPRDDSRNHVESAKSSVTIIVDDHDTEDTAHADDTKPGILANEKISTESKKAMGGKTP